MWGRLAWAAELIRRARAEGRRAARSLTTQFVVDAVGQSDCALLDTVDRAHRELDLKRAYFSAFHPIARSPFPNLPAEDPTRALRLYQADFMLRDYGFSAGELPFGIAANCCDSWRNHVTRCSNSCGVRPHTAAIVTVRLTALCRLAPL